ncbi:MAG: hypothetical protein C5B57_10935, partial [Blastocatellia bacterium]
MALLRKLAGRSDGQSDAEQPSGRLEQVLASVQRERQEIEALVASVDGCRSALPDMRSAVDDASRYASALSGRLDDLSVRIDNVAQSMHTIDALESRIAVLENSLQQSEARASNALQQTAEIESRRESLEKLTALAAEVLARIDDVKRDGADLARLEKEFPGVLRECEHIRTEQTKLSGEIEHLRNSTAELGENADKTRRTSQEARENAEKAALTMADIQQKFAALPQIDSLNHDTGAQLQTLKALAEHVAAKLKALESQHQTVDHALVESRRVSEMVWNMEVQVGRLNEGLALGARVEENLAALGRLHVETTAELEAAARGRAELAEVLEQQRRNATELLQTLEMRLDRLALNKKEIETLGERLAAAHSSLSDMEGRLAAVSVAEETVSSLGEKIDGLSSRFGEMSALAGSLEHRQTELSALEIRLNGLEATSKRTGWQLESLVERRHELDALKKAFEEFDSMLAGAQAISDRVRADKEDLTRFVDETQRFRYDAPQLAASIAALRARAADAEESVRRAIDMEPKVQDLVSEVELLTPRLRIIDDIQARLSELHRSSAEVDRTLTTQLARQAEIESVKVACDGLSTRLTDAQHQLATLSAAQGRLASVPEQISQLEAEVSAA